MKLYLSLILPEFIIGLYWLLPVLLTDADRDEERELVRKAQKGDQYAFEKLVKQYQKPVYHLAMRIVLNHMDADEVVQETFLKAYLHLNDFSDKYKFFTWLYRITVNTAFSLLKKRKKGGDSLDTLSDEDGFQFAGQDDVFQEYKNKELSDIVSKALNDISPEMRTVFILRTWGGLSYKEIAEALEISEGTVMSRLNRARSKLQAALKKTGGYK
jgi:RNA polymerase sigma-70 factor (ECF subfamily)